MATTKITIEVLGEQYAIKCQEEARDKLARAEKELVAICERVQKNNTPIARDRVLVVAALNFAAQVLDSSTQQQIYAERMQLLSEKIDMIE